MSLRLDWIYQYIVIQFFEIKENGIDYKQWFDTGHIMNLFETKIPLIYFKVFYHQYTHLQLV